MTFYGGKTFRSYKKIKIEFDVLVVQRYIFCQKKPWQPLGLVYAEFRDFLEKWSEWSIYAVVSDRIFCISWVVVDHSFS